jgi:putative ABC transport system permease protein
MSLIRRILNLRRREKLDAEIQAELRSHIEMAVEDGIRQGMAEQEARREAILRFGNTGLVLESVADEDMFLSLNSIGSDVLYAFRQLRRAPAFSLPAVLTLAIGIGASTAVFSLVQAFLLRPLPYPDASRLVLVWEQLRVLGIDRFPAPVGDFVDYKNENRVFDDMGAVEDTHLVLRAGDYPERVFAVRTTANVFPMMGLRAALGRTFWPSENQPGHGNAAVLSDVLWRERFGSDRAILGKDIVLDGKNYRVVGVLAHNARFSLGYPQTPDIWLPLPLVADPGRNIGQLQMVAHLRTGVLLDQAQRMMDILASRLQREYHIQMGPHGENPGYGVRLLPLRQELSGNLREPLLLMLGAAALIFLIACVNIANLMLSHGVVREREFAIRIALGAGRVRLVRLLVTEAIAIAFLGMTLGLGIAWAASALLVTLSPYGMAKFLAVSLDANVLGYAAGLGLIAMMVFGFMPGLLIVHRARSIAARTGRLVLSERRGRSLRSILVVVETALSVTLVLAAGMLIHSFLRLQEVPLGFEPNGVLTAQINLPSSYSTGMAQSQFYERLLEQVRSIAAIKGVAATTMLPASDRVLHDPFSIEGLSWQPFGAARVPQFANHQAVSPDYFRVMGISVRQGSGFSSQNKNESQPVAIVNETLVRGFWPGENPIGKHLILGAPQPGVRWLTVVGVAADVRSGGATAESLPEIYTPMTQTPSAAMALVLNAKINDPSRVANDLRDALRTEDRGIPLERVATYEELLETQFAPRRYQMFLLAAFAGLALLLAAVGLYGVVSYAVTQRTGEIGLRMAFGASSQDVTAMVLKQAFLLAGSGLAIGMAMSLLTRQILANEIFGISFLDLPLYMAVILLLATVALAAAALPARRAASIDPMLTLRME